MSNFPLVIAQLKKERDRLNEAIAALEYLSNGASRRTSTTKRVISIEARKRIAAAQKARWAKWRKQHKAA